MRAHLHTESFIELMIQADTHIVSKVVIESERKEFLELEISQIVVIVIP